MMELLHRVLATPLTSAAVLCAAGAAGGLFGLVLPNTICFLLAGLILMGASHRGHAPAE